MMTVRTGPHWPPGNSWPGVFILGDDAIFTAPSFRRLADEMVGPEWGKIMLRKHADLLESCKIDVSSAPRDGASHDGSDSPVNVTATK